MPLLIVLDRGHGFAYADPKRFDPGCASAAHREVDLAGAYIATAAERLRAAGHTVVTMEAGLYEERHRQALAAARQHAGLDALYVQCHVNAGGGKYGVVEHDARSTWGRTAAACLADALDEVAEVPTAHVWELHPGERGWVCIDDIYASPTMAGLIYEPGFIDGPTHASLWTPDGLVRVGTALAEGVRRYALSLSARTTKKAA